MKNPFLVIFALIFTVGGLGANCLGQEVGDLPSDLIEREVAANPSSHEHRVIAGFHYFDRGDYRKASEHFKKASEIAPDDAYDQAWRYMSQIRIAPGESDKFVRNFLKAKETPEFIFTNIRILLGDISATEGVNLAKGSQDPGNLCEAHYYAAQRLFADGKSEEAKRQLAEAVKTGETEYWEYKSASAILKQLHIAESQ